MTNFTIIQHGLYIVRTQAGFKQASKHFWGDYRPPDGVLSYPKSYPSVVAFSEYVEGCARYISANCIHVNALLEAIELDRQTNEEV